MNGNNYDLERESLYNYVLSREDGPQYNGYQNEVDEPSEHNVNNPSENVQEHKSKINWLVVLLLLLVLLGALYYYRCSKKKNLMNAMPVQQRAVATMRGYTMDGSRLNFY